MMEVVQISSIASQVSGVFNSAHTTRFSLAMCSSVQSVGIFSLDAKRKGSRVTLVLCSRAISFAAAMPSSRVHVPGMLTRDLE